MRALRILLQAIVFFFLLAAVLAIGSPETGLVEKLVLALLAAGLVWIAVQLRHIGPPHGPRST
jgi:ABC-type transport system involved in cytochrome c biogenesis permease component